MTLIIRLRLGIDTTEGVDLLHCLMVLLHDSLEAKKFDIRMLERNIARGTLTRDQAKDYSKSLPDDANDAEWVSIESFVDDDQD